MHVEHDVTWKILA
jgi:hypothetical protein